MGDYYGHAGGASSASNPSPQKQPSASAGLDQGMFFCVTIHWHNFLYFPVANISCVFIYLFIFEMKNLHQEKYLLVACPGKQQKNRSDGILNNMDQSLVSK
jgi:hypothetical protein